MPLLLHYKFPGAPESAWMLIRRAGDAAGPDPRIDGLGKFGVLNYPHRFAGKVGKTFPLAGRLHPAIEHTEYHPAVSLLQNVLKVQASV